jgi:hypothetical protein
VKITVQPSPTITELDGVPVRMWTGETDAGVPIILAVHRVIVDERDEQQFARQLTTYPPPLELDTELEVLIARTFSDA